MFTSGLDGKKLGEDIGKFYLELKEKGLPEELISEFVKEYFRKKIEMVPSIEKLLKEVFQSRISEVKEVEEK